MADLIERKEWLIRKGAYFYRPNKSGYTTAKSEAGRYTKADAEREASIEPWHMFAFHQDEVPNAPDTDTELASLRFRLAEVERENADFRTWGIIEVAVRNPNVMEYMRHWEARAEAAEARAGRLEKALEIAYGILWRDMVASPLGIDARKVLLSAIEKDGQRRGIQAAIDKYGSVTEHEVLHSEDGGGAWPAGCSKPNSCSRNKACMYGCSTHLNRDIAAEVNAEIARRAALTEEKP